MGIGNTLATTTKVITKITCGVHAFQDNFPLRAKPQTSAKAQRPPIGVTQAIDHCCQAAMALGLTMDDAQYP